MQNENTNDPSVLLSLYLTEEQIEQIKEDAKKSNAKSVSGYCVEVLTGNSENGDFLTDVANLLAAITFVFENKTKTLISVEEERLLLTKVKNNVNYIFEYLEKINGEDVDDVVLSALSAINASDFKSNSISDEDFADFRSSYNKRKTQLQLRD